MSLPEEDHFFTCPYCLAQISIRIDLTGGGRQSFVYDCEICCQPIAISIELDSGGILSFNADKES